MLTEGTVLAFAGTALGVSLAFALTRYLAHQGSIALPLLSTIKVDGAALGWTLLITGTVSLLFGLVPGLKLAAGIYPRHVERADRESQGGSTNGCAEPW